MSKRTSVVNVLGDYEETMERLALHLGRDKIRRQVFDIIYGRGSKLKSKNQIAEMIGKSGAQAQVVQDALEHLAKHHLIERVENKGIVADRSRWVYGKEEHVRANRDKIVRLANNPQTARQMATKRRPSLALPKALSFVKANPVHKKATTARRQRKQQSQFRIAFLASNPSDEARLRTDIELKAVKRAVNASGNRERIDLEPFPAASFSDLLRALNEYHPQIIHFSGHAGSGSLAFDSEEDSDFGSAVLDFDVINEVVMAIDEPPRMLVFNACDTVAGADVFTETVDAVLAMSDSIADVAALVFAPTFYAALSAGQSVNSALAQGRAMLKAQQIPDHDLPTLLLKSGVEASKLKFV